MFGTATILLILIFIFYSLLGLAFFYKKRLKDVDILEATKERSYEIVQMAVKKAQDIIASAEMEGLKVTSDTKFFQQKLEKQFESNLDQTSTQAQTVLSEDIGKAESEFMQYLSAMRTNLDKVGSDFISYLNYLKTEADLAKNQSQETIRQDIGQIFVKFEEDLSSYLVTTQQQSFKSIELELKSARQLIDAYKQQQLKVIDENIIAMLEQTLSLVIAKKLSLKDQIDLVYEALEKAKSEKFIV